MLLPDNIHPEQTVYYNGGIVLAAMQKNESIELLDLYAETKKIKEMSMPIFILCLDWLYLLNVAKITSQGRVELCI
ncbi:MULTISPECIES: ABC-three component system middle component 6 [unclassified Pseudomonas]|nr:MULTISPECIES: ABC-three component system middle component 6 [unclassified Pseudomonas]PMZ83300.1 hypothetical protein C1X61_30160 [Pseudomonas sp. FW215-T2]PNA06698.1 hypothetical protein C1X62_27930 [Pseudomonas sp. FW215-R3]